MALILVEIFALGAAIGYLIILIIFLQAYDLGNELQVFFLFVTFFDNIAFFFSFKIKVKGPGQNFYKLLKIYCLVITVFFKFI